MDCEGKVIVGAISLLIVFISTSVLAILAPLIYSDVPFHPLQNPLLFWMFIPIFLLLVLLIFISYYRAAYSSPGYPSKELNHQYAMDIQQFKQVSLKHVEHKKLRKNHPQLYPLQAEINDLKETSYCEKCDCIKQSRVHHCKLCRKCIIRMDHHCPWVGNCVGKHNHKYFWLFLLYATVGLALVVGFGIVDGLRNWFYISKLTDPTIEIMGIAFVASFFLDISIGFLLVTQTYDICHNVTTLESFIQGFQSENPFDKKNWKENMKEIMGDSFWIFPTNPFPEKEPTDLGVMEYQH